jgi:hypothetical protein
MATGNTKIIYSKPAPFAVPTVSFKEDEVFTGALSFLNQFFPLIAIPRETFHYSALLVEDIMDKITKEYEARSQTPPQFKRYKAGTDDFELFDPDPVNGSNISQVLVKYFPSIVQDIQDAITTLVTDTRYPDDMGSLMARVFGQNTVTHTGTTGYWTASTRIKNGYIVPATNSDGSETLNPLNRIVVATPSFPFQPDDEHVRNPLPRMGVDPIGNAFVRNEAGSIESSATDWPASVLTGRNAEGQLEGVDEDVPMTSDTTPGPFSRKNIQNTSTGFGAGKEDVDGGYNFLTHHPLIIEQLRYQPPIIERFDGPEKIRERNYQSSVFSNQDPRIAFILSNPVEMTWRMNWDKWLVKGLASSSSNGLRLINSPAKFQPSQGGRSIVTECPFAVFFPPPSTICSCSAGERAHAIWTSSAEPLLWNAVIINNSGPSASPKSVGPKTRMRFKFNYVSSAGGPNPHSFFGIYVRATSVGGVNDQPFIPIFIEPGDGGPASTQFNETAIIAKQSGNDSFGDAWKQTHSDGSISIPISEAIQVSYPQLSIGADTVIAIAIFMEERVSGSFECFAEEGEGGRFLPSFCFTALQCVMGTQTLDLEYLMFYEPPLSDINDIRLI